MYVQSAFVYIFLCIEVVIKENNENDVHCPGNMSAGINEERV